MGPPSNPSRFGGIEGREVPLLPVVVQGEPRQVVRPGLAAEGGALEAGEPPLLHEEGEGRPAGQPGDVRHHVVDDRTARGHGGRREHRVGAQHRGEGGAGGDAPDHLQAVELVAQHLQRRVGSRQDGVEDGLLQVGGLAHRSPRDGTARPGAAP